MLNAGDHLINSVSLAHHKEKILEIDKNNNHIQIIKEKIKDEFYCKILLGCLNCDFQKRFSAIKLLFILYQPNLFFLLN